MPTIEESKRQVKAGLESWKDSVDHDAVLADLQAEIDAHNSRSSPPQDGQDDHRHERRKRRRREDSHHSRSHFRFKAGVDDPRDRRRKHRSSVKDQHRHKGDRKYSPPASTAEVSAHPFPREPVASDHDGGKDPNVAFRESLFDALADDEGAAYWESVYDQPIHIYPRPTVETPEGELEQMNDDQYAAYVQTKMWEKKHPHIVQERERTERRKREEEEASARRREEYVRRKERAAWERAQSAGAKRFAGEDNEGEAYEYVFDFDQSTRYAAASSASRKDFDEYRRAWAAYLANWESLKADLAEHKEAREMAKRIPWPVLPSKPVIRANIEAFFEHMPPSQDDRSKLQMLKVERVRWHPDKIQQRFGESVTADTIKLVTGIFQIIDRLVEEERKRTNEM